MGQDQHERRRGKRANVQAPLLIRRPGTQPNEPPAEEVAENVSLGGAYFRTSRKEAYAVNDVVIASVSVPESYTRVFPFSRVAGRSRVVRVIELLGPEASGPAQVGVALEFHKDLTALTAIPSQT